MHACMDGWMSEIVCAWEMHFNTFCQSDKDKMSEDPPPYADTYSTHLSTPGVLSHHTAAAKCPTILTEVCDLPAALSNY